MSIIFVWAAGSVHRIFLFFFLHFDVSSFFWCLCVSGSSHQPELFFFSLLLLFTASFLRSSKSKDERRQCVSSSAAGSLSLTAVRPLTEAAH